MGGSARKTGKTAGKSHQQQLALAPMGAGVAIKTPLHAGGTSSQRSKQHQSRLEDMAAQPRSTPRIPRARTATPGGSAQAGPSRVVNSSDGARTPFQSKDGNAVAGTSRGAAAMASKSATASNSKGKCKEKAMAPLPLPARLIDDRRPHDEDDAPDYQSPAPSFPTPSTLARTSPKRPRSPDIQEKASSYPHVVEGATTPQRKGARSPAATPRSSAERKRALSLVSRSTKRGGPPQSHPARTAGSSSPSRLRIGNANGGKVLSPRSRARSQPSRIPRPLVLKKARAAAADLPEQEEEDYSHVPLTSRRLVVRHREFSPGMFYGVEIVCIDRAAEAAAKAQGQGQGQASDEVSSEHHDQQQQQQPCDPEAMLRTGTKRPRAGKVAYDSGFAVTARKAGQTSSSPARAPLDRSRLALEYGANDAAQDEKRGDEERLRRVKRPRRSSSSPSAGRRAGPSAAPAAPLMPSPPQLSEPSQHVAQGPQAAPQDGCAAQEQETQEPETEWESAQFRVPDPPAPPPVASHAASTEAMPPPPPAAAKVALTRVKVKPAPRRGPRDAFEALDADWAGHEGHSTVAGRESLKASVEDLSQSTARRRKSTTQAPQQQLPQQQQLQMTDFVTLHPSAAKLARQERESQLQQRLDAHLASAIRESTAQRPKSAPHAGDKAAAGEIEEVPASEDEEAGLLSLDAPLRSSATALPEGDTTIKPDVPDVDVVYESADEEEIALDDVRELSRVKHTPSLVLQDLQLPTVSQEPASKESTPPPPTMSEEHIADSQEAPPLENTLNDAEVDDDDEEVPTQSEPAMSQSEGGQEEVMPHGLPADVVKQLREALRDAGDCLDEGHDGGRPLNSFARELDEALRKMHAGEPDSSQELTPRQSDHDLEGGETQEARHYDSDNEVLPETHPREPFGFGHGAELEEFVHKSERSK